MYTTKARVSYSQLAPDCRLSLTALLDLFQDCGAFQAEDAGLGLSVLDARGQGWLLSRWRVRLLAPLPKIGSTVTVSTQVYSCRISMAHRHYWLRSEDGALLAEGDARSPLSPAVRIIWSPPSWRRRRDFPAAFRLPKGRRCPPSP